MSAQLLKFFLGSLFTLKLLASEADIPKVIYGSDDRFDIFESSDTLAKELAKSTASQIIVTNLIQEGDHFTIKANTLVEKGICPRERFSSQMTASRCSGFLVSPDTLVTAGHCVAMMGECTYFSWVFDYANTTEERSTFTFHKDQVYRCTKIIAREQNYPGDQNDYAVIKLDRPVIGRTPLKLRTTGKPADDAIFTVIGNPSGLPIKITSSVEMRDNSNPIFFRTNSDTFGGSSGSAVIDSRTGIVEGILVRGDHDYTKSTNESCMVSVHRDQNGGRGEDVTRITKIPFFQTPLKR